MNNGEISDDFVDLGDLAPPEVPVDVEDEGPPLRHDAFEPELAGMLEDPGTVFVVQVLVIFMDAPDHAAVLGHRVVGQSCYGGTDVLDVRPATR